MATKNFILDDDSVKRLDLERNSGELFVTDDQGEVEIILYSIKEEVLKRLSSTGNIVTKKLGAWDIQASEFKQSLDVSGQDGTSVGIFIRNDGLKLYTVGATNDNIYEYDLSTAWDISTATFLQSLDVSGQDTNPAGVFFRDDGLKMYLAGIQNDNIYEYDLSTAWDISTATFLQSLDVSGQDTAPDGPFFRSDGLKMYLAGVTSDSILEYDLSTAWDISTATFLQSLDVSGQDTGPRELFFRSDGLKMYFPGTSNDNIYEYDLSTAWDISTATFLQSLDVSGQDGFPAGVFFRDDGLKMYFIGDTNDNVYEYNIINELDGKTGNDGNITIANTPNDKLDLENRIGGQRRFRIEVES